MCVGLFNRDNETSWPGRFINVRDGVELIMNDLHLKKIRHSSHYEVRIKLSLIIRLRWLKG